MQTTGRLVACCAVLAGMSGLGFSNLGVKEFAVTAKRASTVELNEVKKKKKKKKKKKNCAS